MTLMYVAKSSLKARFHLYSATDKIKCDVFISLQTEQRSVMEKCVNAEPRHGEVWCQVAKATVNWRKKTRELLPTVARVLKSVETL